MRGIASKILAIIVVIIVGYSVVWFFKTSSTKKYLSAHIQTSDGQIKADKISVSGYPFKQKLVIENLKFQPSNLDKEIPIANSYKILVKKIEGSSGLFSSDFSVDKIEGISFEDESGNRGSVEFKSDPKINFSYVNNKKANFSYQDNGYKIIDGSTNQVIYENGGSLIEFSAIVDGNNLNQKIKVEFKDIEGIDIASLKKPKANNLIPSDTRMEIIGGGENNQALAANQNNVLDDSVKKYFFFDVEYVLTPKPQAAGEIPNPGIDQEYDINNISLNNFEISSSIYSIKANGKFSRGADNQDLTSTVDATIRIEKLDNIITLTKQAFEESSKPDF